MNEKKEEEIIIKPKIIEINKIEHQSKLEIDNREYDNDNEYDLLEDEDKHVVHYHGQIVVQQHLM